MREPVHRSPRRAREMASGLGPALRRRAIASALALAVVAGALAVGSTMARGSVVPRATSSAGPIAPAAAATGQVTAGPDARFHVNGHTILLRGVTLFKGWMHNWYPTIRSWGMNMVRFPVYWTRIEPKAPTKNPDGTWTHHYDGSYLNTLASDIALARQAGLYSFVALYDDGVSYFGFPDWLYQASYNSKRTTYAKTPQGRSQAEADFWSDDLRQSFMIAVLHGIAHRLTGTGGVIGYGLMNEPQFGSLPHVSTTTSATLGFQLRAARSVRTADPKRVIVFTTRGATGAGLPRANLTGWKSLGNVAFDLHDYFGARWGTGLLENPSSPNFEEQGQNLYEPISGDTQGPPYIGTTLGHERFYRTFLAPLKRSGIPLLVGEFGDQWGPPGVWTFLGTVISALTELRVSWAVNWDQVVNKSGNLTPWSSIVLGALRAG